MLANFLKKNKWLLSLFIYKEVIDQRYSVENYQIHVIQIWGEKKNQKSEWMKYNPTIIDSEGFAHLLGPQVENIINEAILPKVLFLSF